MFDTMTMTKVVGAFCGALLVYLLGNWVGEALYHPSAPEQQAYVIDTGEEETGEAEAAPEQDIIAMVQEASADDGARVFRQCQACHNAEAEQNGAGPHLVGVMGRQIASVGGFNYSGALPDGEWGIENMDPWLENPSDWAPGTSMGYAGLGDMQDRADVIKYLISHSPDYQMPEPAAAGSDDEAAAAEETATESAEAPAEEAEATGGSGDAESAAAASEGTEMAAMDAPEDSAQAADDSGGDDGASPIQAAYETADVDAGKRVWRQCQACHVADQEQNRVGPHLVGLLGREIGSIEGFRYSGALPEGEWTLEELSAWLEAPQDYAPGTSMGYAGLEDVQDRANVIAYIESLN